MQQTPENKRRSDLRTGCIMLAAMLLVSFAFGMLVGSGLSRRKASAPAEDTAPTRQTVVAPVPVACTAEPEAVDTTERYYPVPLTAGMQEYTIDLCRTYEVPVALVLAMMQVESGFDPDCISRTNDYGLMQINVCNHQWLSDKLGITDFLDPEQNILAGVYLMSGHLQAVNGDVSKALMRYNCGATGAGRLWSRGIYSTEYTRKVMEVYAQYKK